MTKFNLSKKIVKGIAYVLVYGIVFGLLALFAGWIWLGVIDVYSMIF